MSELLSLAEIHAARQRIGHAVRRTPLVHSATLSERLKTNVYVKLELFQKTGSFKPRGAFNKALSLPEEQRRRGIVAVSGGNHAQAVAYAGRALGLKALVLMPESTPQNYLEATRGYGATVRLFPNVRLAFDEIPNYEKDGWAVIHPFDDPLVIAGQGTAGLEILEDLPEVTDVIASIGGGGFIGGVATAIKSLKPLVRIWGVETEGADAMAKALAAGRVVELPAITSIARTLGAPAVSERTLALAQAYLEGVTVIPDSEAVDALIFLLERLKVVTEPAASCTLAAADRLAPQFSKGSHVVLVLCGGNIAAADLAKLCAGR